MCPESFGGVRFDIILCMSRFNHVSSRDTMRQDAISSFVCYLWWNGLSCPQLIIGNHIASLSVIGNFKLFIIL